MVNIRFDKKTAVLLAGTGTVIIVVLLATVSLFNRAREAGREAKALEEETASVREALQLKERFRQKGKLFSRDQISLAIDEITKVGAAEGVEFLSIKPQRIAKPQGSPYAVLSIDMDLKSEYGDLGAFLSALEGLPQGLIVVQGFQIKRDPAILPKIRTDLTAEIYLQEGDNG